MPEDCEPSKADLRDSICLWVIGQGRKLPGLKRDSANDIFQIEPQNQDTMFG